MIYTGLYQLPRPLIHCCLKSSKELVFWISPFQERMNQLFENYLHSWLFLFSGPNKHSSAVTCLQFNKKFVITSSDDGTVKIWDLKSGEFLRNLVALDSGGSGGVVWRVRCSNTKLVCAVGSRNGTEETKLHVLDFDVDEKKSLYWIKTGI